MLSPPTRRESKHTAPSTRVARTSAAVSVGADDDTAWVRAKRREGTELSGKWRIDKLIGTGGMAAVYAATHRNRNRVAIKVLHEEFATCPEVGSRFLREGYVANTVSHSGAVHVFDDGVTADRCPFLVMELLEGNALDRLIMTHGPMAGFDALQLIDRVLDVLVSAHAHGIIHRDIKPCNIFLQSNGVVKVLDFGIARLLEGPVTAESVDVDWNVVVGTPSFMAHEQALGHWHEVDARTDVWAAGATLRFLLTSRRLRQAHSVQETLVLAATQPVPPIRDEIPDLAPHIAHVIDRAVAFSADERWQSAHDMQTAVRQAIAQLQALPTSRLPPPAPLPGASSSTSAPAITAFSSASSQSGASAAAGLPGKARKYRPWALGSAAAAVGLAAMLLGSQAPNARVLSTHDSQANPGGKLLQPSPVPALLARLHIGARAMPVSELPIAPERRPPGATPIAPPRSGSAVERPALDAPAAPVAPSRPPTNATVPARAASLPARDVPRESESGRTAATALSDDPFSRRF